jgi:hypothetical protein
MLHNTKNFLFKNFKIKDLVDVSYVIGIEILDDISQGVLGLSKRNYVENMLKEMTYKIVNQEIPYNKKR